MAHVIKFLLGEFWITLCACVCLACGRLTWSSCCWLSLPLLWMTKALRICSSLPRSVAAALVVAATAVGGLVAQWLKFMIDRSTT